MKKYAGKRCFNVKTNNIGGKFLLILQIGKSLGKNLPFKKFLLKNLKVSAGK